MKPSLHVFRPDGGPAFELWAPLKLQELHPPDSVAALVDVVEEGFAPNLVIGHDRVDAEMTLGALVARLEQDASALPGAQLRPGRTIDGNAGQVRIIAFTHDGRPESGPLYQMTASLLAPLNGGDERDLVYLTGTATVAQSGDWHPIFAQAARTVRFG